MHTTQNIQKNTQASVIKPLVSFIVTTYNIPSQMLHQCISSIMSLTLNREQREIIVVDDGSEEPVLTQMKDFANDILYIRQRNQGLSVARNTGLQFAVGKYVQFVDGDDYLLPMPYEHCLDILKYHQPTDMVLFNLTSKTGTPKSFNYKGPYGGAEYMLNNNIHGSACGYIFNKDMLGDLTFTPGIYHEDEEFTPQLLLMARKVYSTNASAYYYRKRNNSIIHNKKTIHKEKRLDDFLNIILRLQKVQSSLDADKYNALGRRIAQLTMDYLYNILKLTRSYNRLKQAKNVLTAHNLYPLPDQDYTLKYKLFRKFI